MKKIILSLSVLAILMILLSAMTVVSIASYAGEYERREQLMRSHYPAPQKDSYLSHWNSVILNKILHMPNAEIAYHSGSIGLDSGEWSVNGGVIVCKITSAFTRILGCLDANGKYVGQPITGMELRKMGL